LKDVVVINLRFIWSEDYHIYSYACTCIPRLGYTYLPLLSPFLLSSPLSSWLHLFFLLSAHTYSKSCIYPPLIPSPSRLNVGATSVPEPFPFQPNFTSSLLPFVNGLTLPSTCSGGLVLRGFYFMLVALAGSELLPWNVGSAEHYECSCRCRCRWRKRGETRE